MAGTLYVVATPLGNLDDLSPRAAATLTRVAAVAAEDTRHTKPLLAHVGSRAVLLSFHAHSSDAALRRTAPRSRDGVRWRSPGRRGPRADQGVRGDPRRDPHRAGGLLRRSAAPRRSDGGGRGYRQIRARRPHPRPPRSGSARPRIAGPRHDPSRRGGAGGGGDGDHAKHGVSAGKRTLRPLAIIVVALWLPVADGAECGVRSAECGIDAHTSTPHSTLRTPHSASLTIGRLHYDGGGDWYAGPSALPNLLAAIRQRTALPVAERERVVTLTGPELWDVPYLYVTGHGNVRFSDDEVRILRRWLEQGGFLHADDDYGMDKSFRREIVRVFPDHPLVEVPLSHPIYHVVYDLPQGTPKIEEHDGLPAQGFGIFLGNRLVVYYDYQADLNDGWEDPDVNHLPPNLREAALRMGVNLFTYAVSTTR